MTTRTRFIAAALLATASAFALAKPPSPFERLITQILAQLDQQSESDQRIIDQTIALRKNLQKAEDDRARNQLPVARDAALSREAFVAANQMIATPQRTKLIFDSFLRNTLDRQEDILRQSVDGPAATRLATSRLAAQTKARQAVLADLRHDIQSLRKFPTSKERISFLADNVQLIANAVGQRSGAAVPQP